MKAWGKHCVLTARRCNDFIKCPFAITVFSQNLVKAIDMKPHGFPFIERFGEGDKLGYTLVQLIETSNITAHFVEETCDIHLDVFSCKEFDEAVVEEEVIKSFGGVVETKILFR